MTTLEGVGIDGGWPDASGTDGRMRASARGEAHGTRRGWRVRSRVRENESLRIGRMYGSQVGDIF
jgi:hypothetical protein